MPMQDLFFSPVTFNPPSEPSGAKGTANIGIKAWLNPHGTKFSNLNGSYGIGLED